MIKVSNMAVTWSSGPNYCHTTSVTLLVFSLYLFVVGVNVGNCSSVMNDVSTAAPVTANNLATLATPGTTIVPTISPQPPATIGPNPPATIAPPPAGNLCGTQQSNSYNLNTLTTPPYWTLTKLGACFDTYGDKNIGCEFNFAFCKDLPLDVGQKPGAGASQVSTRPGSQRLLLGGRSAVVQNIAGKSPQLVISFENGNTTTTCGTLHVEFNLKCKQDAVWAIPIAGNPGRLPTDTTVALDQVNCKYTLQSNYNGACSTPPSGLSAGSVLIIIFLCSVAAYLIGGIAYNMYSGARGLELIPNYEVWKNFPSDVMGGVGFVFGIITCQKNSKSEEYDNI